MFTKHNMASISNAQLRQDLKGILDGADLTQLSSKKVRKQLEEKYDVDLTDRKAELDGMLMELMAEQENGDKSDEDEGTSRQNNKRSSPSPTKSDSDNSDSDFDEPEDLEPSRKKAKTPSKNDDEEVARRLQEEESGSRRTRSGGAKKRPPVKKNTPKKEGKSKKVTSYSKPSLLSPALAAVVGTDKLPRSDVVKRLWDIVKERDLFDPKNRQFVRCDDELYNLFGRKRVRMFGMMKYLTKHIHNEDEILH